MEFTNTQIRALNYLLPQQYTMEAVECEEPVEIPLKRSTRKKFPTSANKFIPLMRENEVYQKLLSFLQKVKRHPMAGPFLQSHTGELDLTRLEENLRSGKYESAYGMSLDLRTLWGTAYSVYERDTELSVKTTDICEFSENLLRDLIGLESTETREEIHELQKKIDKLAKTHANLKKKIQEATNLEAYTKKKIDRIPKTEPSSRKKADRKMSGAQKQILNSKIAKLDPIYHKGIQGIANEYSSNSHVDLDQLPYQTCKYIENFVKQSQKQMQLCKKATKADSGTQDSQVVTHSDDSIVMSPYSEIGDVL